MTAGLEGTEFEQDDGPSGGGGDVNRLSTHGKFRVGVPVEVTLRKVPESPGRTKRNREDVEPTFLSGGPWTDPRQAETRRHEPGPRKPVYTTGQEGGHGRSKVARE